ncbi:hypothetical protein ACVGWT_24355, partial [Enterobacter hormaechei]
LPEAPSARISRGFEPAGLPPAPPPPALHFIAPNTAAPAAHGLNTISATETPLGKTGYSAANYTNLTKTYTLYLINN